MTNKGVWEESKLAAIIDIVANTNPKKVAPTSPHKQFCLWKVEKQETKRPGSYCVPNDIRKITTMEKANIAEKYADYYCSSSSYAVDSIHEIVGIGHANDPE